MPLYHVFLPPEKLAPLPLPLRVQDYSPLRFETVEITEPETLVGFEAAHGQRESQSLGAAVYADWSLDRRNTTGASTSVYIQKEDGVSREQAIKQLEEEERNSWEKSVIGYGQIGLAALAGSDAAIAKGKRRKTEDFDKLPTGLSIALQPASDPPTSESATDTPGSSRRRSNRLGQARTSLSLLGTLPAGDFSESVLSLNTTASYPSQFTQPPLPKWHIPLSILTPLHSILASTPNKPSRRITKRSRLEPDRDDPKQLYTVMLCVVATDGPVLRRRKEEKEKGKDGTLWIASWRVVAPEPQESLERTKRAKTAATKSRGGTGDASCKVQLWDECAKGWASRVRKGDVILLENAEYRPATPKEPAHLSASTLTSSKMSILYRTLPRQLHANPYAYAYRGSKAGRTRSGSQSQQTELEPEDAALRPDLRLARSDPGVRRVAEMAHWFADWVGGLPPPDL